MQGGFYEAVLHCLRLTDPEAKCDGVLELAGAQLRGDLHRENVAELHKLECPGRPQRPELVDARQVPRRRIGSTSGRAALVHAVAHIEFNAINLALDAAYRFRDLPAEYYLDWISVAVDEARHFRLLRDRLNSLGFDYGDFPAHNGLWQMAVKTAGCCLDRMALVPRVLEARGLDVTPGMIERLQSAGDTETVVALELILAEEVRHVAIGTRWFRFCCEQQGLDPLATFLGLLDRYYPGLVKGPFNLEARYEAGFTAAEMDALIAGLSN